MATFPLSAGARSHSRPPWRQVSWVLLAFGVVALLVVGSIHPATSTRTQRIAYLDSVIKCPSCVDISIAQSTEQTAVALRAKVRTLVDDGWTNAQVESWVTTHFGENELLVPTGGGIDELAWIVPIAVVALAVVALGAVFVRRRRSSAATGSAPDDEALVADALADLLTEEPRR